MARRKVVLVTGASTGIGLAVARQLLPTEFRVVLAAREGSLCRFDEAGILESGEVMIRTLDICDYDQQRAMVEDVAYRWGGVDILINNAGIAYRSVVEEMTPEDTQYQFDVNFLGPMQLTRYVLPWMRRQGWGKVINISSVGGMMAMPTMAAYSASKFALEGASEALWYEVRPWGITVTLIEPGFIHSESFVKVRFSKKSWESAHDPRSPYFYYYHHMGRFVSKLMRASLATPESIATLVLHTIRRPSPPLRLPASLDAWFFHFMRRVLPRRLYHRILYWNLPGIHQWRNIPS